MPWTRDMMGSDPLVPLKSSPRVKVCADAEIAVMVQSVNHHIQIAFRTTHLCRPTAYDREFYSAHFAMYMRTNGPRRASYGITTNGTLLVSVPLGVVTVT